MLNACIEDSRSKGKKGVCYFIVQKEKAFFGRS